MSFSFTINSLNVYNEKYELLESFPNAKPCIHKSPNQPSEPIKKNIKFIDFPDENSTDKEPHKLSLSVSAPHLFISTVPFIKEQNDHLNFPLNYIDTSLYLFGKHLFSGKISNAPMWKDYFTYRILNETSNTVLILNFSIHFQHQLSSIAKQKVDISLFDIL